MCNDSLCKDGEDYSGFINGNGKVLNGVLVGLESGDVIPCGPFTPKSFANSILSCFSCTKMKAIILKAFEIDSFQYSNNIEYCNEIKAKFYEANPKVSCYFISFDHYWLSSMLIAANLTLNPGEFLLMGITSCKSIDVFELKFTETGYIITDKRSVNIDSKNDDEEKDDEEVRNAILGNGDPKKILIMTLSANNPTMVLLKNVLISPKLMAFERNQVENDGRFCQEITKWILNKKKTKYYILPTCSRKYVVTDTVDGSGIPLIVADTHEALPLVKSCVIPRTTLNLSMSYIDDITGKPKVINIKKFGRKCHQYNVTLNIKSKNSALCQVESIILPAIESFPRQITAVDQSEIPVVGFFDQSSVICIWNDEKNVYEFCQAWNGVYGNDMFLNFNQEKPSFGQKAFDLFQTKPDSAVYDLIKIMSMPSSAIKVNPKWNFKVTEDAEHGVLLDFASHDGDRRAASPSFLMAIMLKEHIKVIKKESGTKPEVLGFSVLKGFNEEEKERIKQQIEESCRLLSVECRFLNV
uniref:Uncharacterized protein n=1 Tax=Panagrolaimus sp. ES5 TaxID=591445 RepID=A0AC34FEJ8_9BILA